jgi:hypothetical protein
MLPDMSFLSILQAVCRNADNNQTAQVSRLQSSICPIGRSAIIFPVVPFYVVILYLIDLHPFDYAYLISASLGNSDF